VPPEVGFATKPRLAGRMVERAIAAGVPFAWVAGDSVYGVGEIEMALRRAGKGYVLGVNATQPFNSWIGKPVVAGTAEEIAQGLEPSAWRRLSAGEGTKGPRWDDWRWLPLAPPLEPGWHRWLLVRRSVSDPTDLTAYVVFAPQDATLEAVVRVAGSRWTIESGFEAAKGEVGLDHYEVRSWTGWYRHLTLAMWALAFLVVLRAGALAVEAFKKNPTSEPSSLTRFKAQRGLASH
jgi:SRSO17 transposase